MKRAAVTLCRVRAQQRPDDAAQAFFGARLCRPASAIWGSDSEVDRGFKRLIALVASRAAGDAYSMAHTTSGALHFGVSVDKLAADAIATPLFSPTERAALQVGAVAGAVPNAVTDTMFAELRQHWSETEIVEIVAVIAATGLVNRNATMATPLEDEPMEVGAKQLAKNGWAPGPHRKIVTGGR